MKIRIVITTALLTAFIFFTTAGVAASENPQFIKWVDFNIEAQTLQKAYELDVKTHNEKKHYKFTEILAFIAMKNGNNFKYNKDMANLKKLLSRLDKGETMSEIVGDNKYFNYYYEAYNAIFSDYIGFYTVENKTAYGLKTYFPFAKGYWYSGGDDFGNSRNYGFKRVHLGHDMFGSVGTPIIAVERGVVTEFGWNRFGGWRIGIRSLDNMRYYYYAHLRKDKPYVKGIEKGSIVAAGQVIGYLGVTGYSFKENHNMKAKPHLHFGLQLIFDKSQEDGKGEIWIDVHNICKFLMQNRASVRKDNESGDYISINTKKEIKV